MFQHTGTFVYINWWRTCRSIENRHGIYICSRTSNFCLLFFLTSPLFQLCLHNCMRACVRENFLALSQIFPIQEGLGIRPICVCMYVCLSICRLESKGYFRSNQCHERSKYENKTTMTIKVNKSQINVNKIMQEGVIANMWIKCRSAGKLRLLEKTQ